MNTPQSHRLYTQISSYTCLMHTILHSCFHIHMHMQIHNYVNLYTYTHIHTDVTCRQTLANRSAHLSSPVHTNTCTWACIHSDVHVHFPRLASLRTTRPAVATNITFASQGSHSQLLGPPTDLATSLLWASLHLFSALLVSLFDQAFWPFTSNIPCKKASLMPHPKDLPHQSWVPQTVFSTSTYLLSLCSPPEEPWALRGQWL